MIVRAFWGVHIDLTKIVSVSNAYFIDRMGSGGYYWGFDVHCQLIDRPIHLEFEDHELGVDSHPIDSQGRPGLLPPEMAELEGISKLQPQIEEFIELWKGCQ